MTMFSAGGPAGACVPVADSRKLWRSVLDKADIERHVLGHDFRRSMVNKMIQSGLDRDVVRRTPATLSPACMLC